MSTPNTDNENYYENIKAFEALLKAFKKGMPEIEIGIFEEDNSRKDTSVESNASIGMKHEFGLDGMPIRSFLRMPMTLQLRQFIQGSQAFDKSVLKEVIKEKSVLPWMKKIALIAEQVIQEAFDSGGFGQWKPSNMEHKTNHQTLVETTQLRDSIHAKVKE